MFLKIIEYNCMAICSKECQVGTPNTFRTNCCKKLKTYNNCEKCNIYVCRECYYELQKNNINYCLICRNDIETSDDIQLDNIQVDVIQSKKPRHQKCKIHCDELKTYTKNKCDNCGERCCDNIYIFKELLSYFKNESECCYNICFFLKLIFIPLIVAFIFNILFNGFDSVKDIFLSKDINFIITILILSWLYGFIFCIVVFHIYIRCTESSRSN